LFSGPARPIYGALTVIANPLDVIMLKYLSPLRRCPPEFFLLALVFVLFVFYGVFAVTAAESARGGNAAFYATGTNPWQQTVSPGQSQPVSDHRLAFRLAPAATP
jgi:hypothetical protein